MYFNLLGKSSFIFLKILIYFLKIVFKILIYFFKNPY